MNILIFQILCLQHKGVVSFQLKLSQLFKKHLFLKYLIEHANSFRTNFDVYMYSGWKNLTSKNLNVEMQNKESTFFFRKSLLPKKRV